MEEMLTAADCMAEKLITIHQDASLDEAISLLLSHRISGMPVVGDNGELMGVISEQDCLKSFVESKYHNTPIASVKDAMSKEVASVGSDTDVLTIAELFSKNAYRRLPVLKNSRLVGQVSRRDVLSVIEKWMKPVE